MDTKVLRTPNNPLYPHLPFIAGFLVLKVFPLARLDLKN